MRLHLLEVTAFGPFAETARVDFDELSAGGVFLLTGATGAGKTSVLDAVCFALYGQVPGDRAGARHLRSDHAAPGTPPTVVLHASIGDRTFRFTRSPAWSRPKQRGSGETRVQAHVLVEEHRGGDWIALTNRLDDAGLLVSDLLGMTATQFTQVAMLPQGRFQTFLRASSTERHSVLQKLFRTDRFEQVERWLVDRRGVARRASEDAARHVVDVLSRFQEASGAQLPEAWSEDIAAAAERGDVGAWSTELVDAADAHRAETAATRAAATDHLAEAQEALDAARRMRDLQQRAESAARELVALAARGDELDGLRHRLAAHRRAAPIEPLVARAAQCRRAAERAHERWLQTSASVVDLDTVSRDTLAALHHDALAACAVAEAFRPRAVELEAARQRQVHLARRDGELVASLAALDDAIAEHPAALQIAQAAVDEAHAAATDLVAAERDVADLSDLVAASRRLQVLVSELAEARDEVAHAKDAALAAKEVYLAVREARINGMAAELAGALAVGCACPVCGSASHPAPAHPGDAPVGRAEEDAARRTSEDLAFVQQGHEVRVATLTTEHDTLTAKLEPVARDSLPGRLGAARKRLETARDVAATTDERTRRLHDLRTRADAARTARERVVAELTAARQEADSVATAVTTMTAELETLLGGAAPDLDALVALRRARCEELETAVRSYTAYDEATRAAADSVEAAEAAARQAGFTDAVDAAAALLAPDRAVEIDRTLTAAEAGRIAAEQVLADPDIRAAASAPPPDLDVAVVKHRLAAETLQTAVSADDAATTRARRLESLAAVLIGRLDAWAPLRAEHELVAGLSQLVEGKGPDNPLRIRLAAFVLSERLRQVVAAANERLARMTAQRYVLEHTDERGAGEQRGGLSLRVRDDWNGVSRDPATLSGGETFVVSLALALGLADTVAHEAGGADVDTLFIDEGFGSLDTDTLEDVMDTLDTLRDGGRVVGLVSHVPELRSRVTTQLEVLKGRNGSTVRVVLAGG